MTAAALGPLATRLLTLDNGHGGLLDGALYEPGGEGARPPIVIHLHGKGGNFYTGPGRFLPALLADRPLAHLAINGVCHDLGYLPYHPHPEGGPPQGGMWERLAAGVEDVAAAVDFVRSAGYERVFLSGHSSGCHYATEYAVRDGGVDGLVLLSPVVTFQSFVRRWFPDRAALEATAARARDLVDTGVGHYLIPLAAPYFAISAASLLERLELPVDHFEQQLARVDCPVLLLWGEAESRHRLWTEIHERLGLPAGARVTIAGAGHQYAGAEREVSEHVAAFVRAHA